MGRPGLSNHPKFRRLAHTLGSAPLARGLLELMWEVAYENGDPRLGDPLGVEAAAQWAGERGVFFAALRDAGGPGRAGFIEECDGVWEVHDLYDHAPDYVRKRAKREAERRSTGRTLDAEVRSLTGQNPPETGQRPKYGSPPAPAPAPAPDQEDLIPKTEQNVIAPGVQIQRLWNELMPHPPFPRWLALEGDRKKAAKARWEENPSEGYWREVLSRISRSPWCRGEIAGRDGKTWIADPDFLLRPGTHGKAMEGKYDRREHGANGKPRAPQNANDFKHVTSLADIEAIHRGS